MEVGGTDQGKCGGGGVNVRLGGQWFGLPYLPIVYRWPRARLYHIMCVCYKGRAGGHSRCPGFRVAAAEGDAKPHVLGLGSREWRPCTATCLCVRACLCTHTCIYIHAYHAPTDPLPNTYITRTHTTHTHIQLHVCFSFCVCVCVYSSI